MKNFLLSSVSYGFFSLLILFGICFCAVHLFKLVLIGWEYQKKKSPSSSPPPPTEKPKEEIKPPEKNEPIYYIVEKKKKCAKTTYSTPKPFDFK